MNIQGEIFMVVTNNDKVFEELKDDYNIYGVELYADSLCFFINDQYTGTYRRMPEYGEQQYPFDRPMYLLIDMQLGGKWVGGVNPKDLPYRYQIDYVKFYKKK